MTKWKGKTVDEIDLSEMISILNKGVRTLDELGQEFRNNVNIKETIKMVKSEVNRMFDIYKVLEKLKNPAFKQDYWNKLLAEMYPDETTRPKQTKLALKTLLDDRLMHHDHTINLLFQTADYEYKIEREIIEIEKSLQNIPIEIDLYEQRECKPFYLIYQISNLIPKLNENLSQLLDVQSRTTNPQNLQEISKYHIIINHTQEILEVIDEIQKKMMTVAPIMKSRVKIFYRSEL
jgi:Dynein heavy chain, N-terminal region 2